MQPGLRILLHQAPLSQDRGMFGTPNGLFYHLTPGQSPWRLVEMKENGWQSLREINWNILDYYIYPEHSSVRTLLQALQNKGLYAESGVSVIKQYLGWLVEGSINS